MGTDIEQIIAAVPGWAGRRVTVDEIAGGLTNRNYRVEVDGEPVFVRVPGADTELLAVDRGNELANSRAAAEAGVGPCVLHHLPAWDVMVLEWLPGRTLSNEACQEPGMPERIAEALRRLHAGPRFRDDFDMVRRLSAILTSLKLGIRISTATASTGAPAAHRVALAAQPRLRPRHNDLLAANYIDDGARIWIVDYEYSGNNDPTFELGNTCQELGWDDARVEALCAAYFGEARLALVARMRLQMIMSDVGWTLWAAIQAAVSTIDYDFWGWAEERWVAPRRADGPTSNGGFWMHRAPDAPRPGVTRWPGRDAGHVLRRP
jgi:thiamine kinase-like enzyme